MKHPEVVMDLREVRKSFEMPHAPFKAARRKEAVRGVTLQVRRGDTFAIVGESGSGKTTLARMMLGLLTPCSGRISLCGREIGSVGRAAIARIVQPVFQDPLSSLNPHKTIEAIISLPLRVHGIGDAAARERAVRHMMDCVGLSPRLAAAYPNQLSGGQRQRVAIARALIARPPVLVCDEPTSALDVSVQSQILNLLQDLQREFGLTYVLITHNLAVVEHLASRVAVMYRGEVVEESCARDLFSNAGNAYTRRLLASVLTPEPGLGLPEVAAA